MEFQCEITNNYHAKFILIVGQLLRNPNFSNIIIRYIIDILNDEYKKNMKCL